jgi:rod shape-determining protein MreB
MSRIHKLFSNDIGIDLGTANTLVYLRGKGIVINEPSVVALNQKTGQVVAVGNDAKQMIGRTPNHISVVRPLTNGVISDFEVTEELVAYFVKKAQKLSAGKFIRPRVLVGVPSGITNVERRAVRDASMNAGARIVHIVEEPMAAAIGIRLPIYDPVGNMIIDIGGGTTDIAVISLGGIVRSKNLHIAGDRLNEDIITYVRDEFKILLGEKTAEDVKISIGAVYDQDQPMEATIRGRDLVTGLPREVAITGRDIREAISASISIFINAVKETLESTPPEIVSDIMNRGIVVVGGGSLINGMGRLLGSELRIPIHLAEDPLTAVVRGTGIILEDVEGHRDILLDDENELPPR